ncbi:hypothetical protein GR927_21825 [Mycolicibacterium sp. 3033]|nr:hypothetical protein [Mycolicibacterium aurantiacum]
MAALGSLVFIAVLVGAFLSAPRDWTGSRTILSTYVIALIGMSLYVALPAVLIMFSGTYVWAVGYYSDESFAAAIWLCVAALVAFLYGNALARRRRPPDGSTRTVLAEPVTVPAYAGKSAEVLLFGLLAVGIALKIFLIVDTGGLTNSITRFSSYAREFSGVSHLDADAILLRTLSGIADGAATWGVMRALKDKRHELMWTATLTGTLGLSYVTMGKRLVLLLPIVCVLLAFHVYRRRLTVKLVPAVLLLAVGAGFFTLMARAFLPASVLGYDLSLDRVGYSDGSIVRFYLYSLEFSSLEMISVAMSSGHQIIDMFGGTWNALVSTNFESFLYSVPRGLWPGKPASFYDLSYGISAVLGDTPFEDPTVGYASTLIGTTYMLGGFAAVILSLFVFGLLTGRVDARLARSGWSDMTIVTFAIALVVAFHLFRQGTLGWTFIVSVVQQYGTIAALYALALRSRKFRRSQPSDSQDMVSV